MASPRVSSPVHIISVLLTGGKDLHRLGHGVGYADRHVSHGLECDNVHLLSWYGDLRTQATGVCYRHVGPAGSGELI